MAYNTMVLKKDGKETVAKMNRKETKKPLLQNDNEDDDTIAKTVASDIEEDEIIQDWSHMAKLASTNATLSIPRRGEKDYEPDGSDIQELLLYQARNQMFDTLANSIRGSVVKTQVKAVYIPSRHEALVLNPKGSFLQAMGTVTSTGDFWLKHYEFLYLVERGTVTPYWSPNNENIEKLDDIDNDTIFPLSLEDVYSFFKCQKDMDEFAVYAYLKRLGFVVHKVTDLDSTLFPKQDRSPAKFPFLRSVFKSCTSLFISSRNNLFNGLFFDHKYYTLFRFTSSPQIYENLKLLVPYIRAPRNINDIKSQRFSNNYTYGSNYHVTFNLWKPQINYRKKMPTLPDYQVVVYNKNDKKQHFPAFADFQHIFSQLDYKFDFLEDIDDSFDWDDSTYINNIQRSILVKQTSKKAKKENKKEDIISSNKNKKNTKKTKNTPPHIQQMKRIKNGYRSFLLAVMDNGIISFVKISEADLGSEDVWYVPQPNLKPNKNKKHRNKNSTVRNNRNKDDPNNTTIINKNL